MNSMRVASLLLVAIAAAFILKMLFASEEPAEKLENAGAQHVESVRAEEPPAEALRAPRETDTSARVPVEVAAETAPLPERAGWNVTVVDGAGNPVEGAEVNLVVVAEHMGGMTQKLAEAGPTNASGRVFVEDFPATLSEEQRAGLAEEGNQLRLVPSGLFGARGEREAAGLALLGAPVTSGATSPPVDVTLVRPDAGAVRLRVHSPTGTFPEGFRVYLTAGWRSLLEGSALSRELPAGEAEAYLDFPAIGLGRRFEAEAKGASGSSLGKCSLEGPQTAGATAEAVLELAFGAPRLRGRVRGVLDAPLLAILPHKPTLSSTLSHRRPQSVGEIEVDASGSFDVEAAWLAFEGPRNVTLRLGAGDDPDRAFETTLWVRPEEPIIDLGAFALGPLPVVIGGRVVDQEGEGIATKLEMTFHREGEDEEMHWDRFVQTLESGADGRFVHRGALPEGKIWLSLPSSTHILPGGEGTIREFPSGTADVELVVSGQGWLTADASALPQTHLSHFFITAWRQDAGEEVAKQTRQGFTVKNGPRFGPFNTGSLRVELQVRGVGTMASWDIFLRDGDTHDLGALAMDRPLYAHTVVFDSEAEYMHDGPRVFGKTASRTVPGNENSTGHRHSFLTAEPLESILVQPRGTDHNHEAAIEYEVTGDETHIPWE